MLIHLWKTFLVEANGQCDHGQPVEDALDGARAAALRYEHHHLWMGQGLIDYTSDWLI